VLRNLKVFLAIYLGIYLVLPGCLCETLAVFGFSSDKTEQVDLTLVGDHASWSPVCHCDEVCVKAAEVTVNESHSHEQQLFSRIHLPFQSDFNAPEAFRVVHVGRPPPDRLATQNFHALFSVFLV
jgi:hypothetical protein